MGGHATSLVRGRPKNKQMLEQGSTGTRPDMRKACFLGHRKLPPSVVVKKKSLIYLVTPILGGGQQTDIKRGKYIVWLAKESRKTQEKILENLSTVNTHGRKCPGFETHQIFWEGMGSGTSDMFIHTVRQNLNVNLPQPM